MRLHGNLGISAAFLAACFAFGAAALEPEGPRPGTVFELAVSATSEAEFSRLQAGGYNIGSYNRTTGVATIYATPAEYATLQSEGFQVTELGRQPDPPEFSDAKGLGVYHSYAAVSTHLNDWANAYPAITQLFTLGQSVQGRELWALFISDNPTVEEAEPEFKYVSTLHGNEPVGTELLLYLIDRLLTGYGSDTRITDLVNETAIWIVPLANPDGLEAGLRQNANGFDLNRNFPVFGGDFVGTFFEEPLDVSGRQAETRRLMEWTAANRFVLSGNFHTGELVVNYPYDYTPGIPTFTDAPTPDDALMQALALTYSTPNTPMFTSPFFDDGITNGSAWYSILGGYQDWCYRYLGNIDMTLEVSSAFKPSQAQLPTFWSDNEESLLAYMEAVHIGIRGVVTDVTTGAPVSAKIMVMGNTQPVFTDPDVGDYYRLLLPGTYDLYFEADGYFSEMVENVVVSPGAATQVDTMLEPVPLSANTRAPWWLLALLLMALGAWRMRHAARSEVSA